MWQSRRPVEASEVRLSLRRCLQRAGEDTTGLTPHVPGLTAAYSVSSMARQTSLLAACSTLVTGATPLWCLKEVKVMATWPGPMTSF